MDIGNGKRVLKKTKQNETKEALQEKNAFLY